MRSCQKEKKKIVAKTTHLLRLRADIRDDDEYAAAAAVETRVAAFCEEEKGVSTPPSDQTLLRSLPSDVTQPPLFLPIAPSSTPTVPQGGLTTGTHYNDGLVDKLPNRVFFFLFFSFFCQIFDIGKSQFCEFFQKVSKIIRIYARKTKMSFFFFFSKKEKKFLGKKHPRGQDPGTKKLKRKIICPKILMKYSNKSIKGVGRLY